MHESVDLRTSLQEVVGVLFAQQHRAFDPLSVRQVRGFSFGELNQGPTDPAGLRVSVSPPPVLDEFPRPFHRLVFGRTSADLRHGGRNSATFRPTGAASWATEAAEPVIEDVDTMHP